MWFCDYLRFCCTVNRLRERTKLSRNVDKFVQRVYNFRYVGDWTVVYNFRYIGDWTVHSDLYTMLLLTYPVPKLTASNHAINNSGLDFTDVNSSMVNLVPATV